MSIVTAERPRTGVSVRDLCIGWDRAGTRIEIVPGVSFEVPVGKTLALVGESGTGKSLTARSLLGLLPSPLRVLSGTINMSGVDVTRATETEMRRIRGGVIGFVPQDPMSALNPVRRVDSLFNEVLRRHTGLTSTERRSRTQSVLADVGLSEAVLDRYPHQLSGGMKQRILIALALVTEPTVVVADEPTTALDATVQAEILDLLARHVAGRVALILITHDLGVAATVCDQIAVMYSGRIVEHAPVAALLRMPRHPYTRGLLAAAPDFDPDVESLVPIPGAPPAPDVRPVGCAFEPRCGHSDVQCATLPVLTGSEHRVACWHPQAL